MVNFFAEYKLIFYITNFSLIFLYLFPASFFGCIFYDDCNLQPKLTVDFLNVSSNHFYSFFVISVIGHLSFLKSKKINFLVLYLIFLAIFLETLHLIVPNRSFQWSDLIGNLIGVVIVILIYSFINKYEQF